MIADELMNEDKVNPKVLSLEEQSYRKELRDAVAEVASEFLQENKAEVIRRAEAKIKLRRELEGR